MSWRSAITLMWKWCSSGSGVHGRLAANRLIHPSGAPSAPPASLLGALQGLTFCSWNARALLHFQPHMRAAKLKELGSLLRSFRIVFLQEVHGTEYDFHRTMRSFCTHRSYFCPGVDAATGGVAIMVHVDLISAAQSKSKKSLIPGRLMRLQLAVNYAPLGLCTLTLWNMHDQLLPSDLSRRALRDFEQDLNLALEQPLRYLLLFGGDMNRLAANEQRWYLDPLRQAEQAGNTSTHTHYLSSDQVAWDKALSLLTECATHQFSHFSQAERFEARLDRLWWNVPPWLARLYTI
eukprot:3896612-Karenia_brevis.AAC.1